MSEPLRIEAEVDASHRLHGIVPNAVPPGKVSLTLQPSSKLTPKEKKAKQLALAGAWRDVAFRRLRQDTSDRITAW